MDSPPLELATEIVLPLGAQKHDPAWKHCLMIKRGEKTHLKCIYCLKIFSGGGIHRIKEHLACQKGNASRCSKVLPEVRDAMRESLAGVVVRKRKKQRLAEEVKKLNSVSQPETLLTNVNADAGSPLSVVPISIVEQGSSNPDGEDYAPVARAIGRGRKRKVKNSPVPSPGVLDSTPAEGAPVMSTSKDRAHMAIGRFLFEAGVPLDSVNSAHFKTMIDAIVSSGPGLASPSYHDIRGWILKRTLDEMRSRLWHLKGIWTRNGCSVLADEWITEMNRTLINFLVYCSEGVLFLKSVDASQIVTSADALFELLKHVVEEVGVKDVVQVITNTSVTHALAGKMLMETFPTVFWTPCSIQSVDSILIDFSKMKQISWVLEQAQMITSFVYGHAPVLNMVKRYTGGKELVQPSISAATTDFSTLKAMVSLKDGLQMLMTSKEWMDSPYSKMPKSLSVVDLICNPDFWSSCISTVRLTEPFLRVLRIADSGSRPAMGYIYLSMHCAKQRIKKELKKRNHYMPYWDIIDRKWNKVLPRPLHLAGFFLNPRFFYKIKEIPNAIMSGMLDCIEMLVPEVKIQDKINKELGLYKNASGDFGRKMSIRARDTLLPAEWWSTYGGGCPNLARLAVRILSQTCSARRCDRGKIPFEQIHTQRKNGLESQRFIDLIFVRYNLRLQKRPFLRNQSSDPISTDNYIGNVEDWVVEKSDIFPAGISSSWMELDQPFSNGLSENADAEEDDLLSDGFNDDEIPCLCAGDGDEEDFAEEDDGLENNEEQNSLGGSHATII